MNGDADGNGSTDIADLVMVASHFNTCPAGGEGDLNDDGLVDIYDLVLVGKRFGRQVPVPAPWVLDVRFGRGGDGELTTVMKIL